MKQKFSTELDVWVRSDGRKTLESLENVFAERSFALIFLILMSVPALPIPTGGVTHVLEVIVMLLCLELIAGRRSIWLPEKWRKLQLNDSMRKKSIPFLVRKIRWLERFTRPRMSGLLDATAGRSIIGVVILGFTAAAFIAPPFSGLDTLPALGVVVISLGLILEDIAVVAAGSLIGVAGVGLIVGFSGAIVHFVRSIFG